MINFQEMAPYKGTQRFSNNELPFLHQNMNNFHMINENSLHYIIIQQLHKIEIQ